MKRTLLILCAALALVLPAACRGDDTMASRSAAAYREAQAKGVPIAGGHEHGGHAAASTTADHADHSMDADAHDGMSHDMPAGHDAMQHDAMQHDATQHDTMQHGTMQHGAMQHDAMQHDTMQHGAMQHEAMQHDAASPHAAHTAAPSSGPAPSVTVSAPTSNADIGRIRPAATLQPDDFDAPAPAAVADAQKATRGSMAGHAHETSGATETVYTCPMHPEVKSATPGKCPICGMTLVKKE